MSMINPTAETEIRPGTMFDGLSPLPADPVVAMAYVPFQQNKAAYDDDDALREGTLFKTLNKPFLRGAIR